MFLLRRIDIFSFFSFFFSFATTERFPKVTDWVQRRQLCKCLNLVAFHCPVQWDRLFFNTVFVHVCARSSVNCICIKTRTNPSSITRSDFSSARGNCNSDVQKMLFSSAALILFPRTCTTLISLEGLFFLLLLLPVLFPLTDFPPQIIFSDRSRVLRFPGSI